MGVYTQNKVIAMNNNVKTTYGTSVSTGNITIIYTLVIIMEKLVAT